MNRRLFNTLSGTLVLGEAFNILSPFETFGSAFSENKHLDRPLGIYINWASYDELSDVVKLDFPLAMKELEQVIRYRSAGIQLDYYLMDMFWFDKSGGYRIPRKESWPQGTFDVWLERCAKQGIKPGLWFSTNTLSINGNRFLDPIPSWRDSMNSKGTAMCLFSGGFLNEFVQTLQLWYNQGVRIFKFDFADFSAATPEIENILTPSEITEQNTTAWRTAMKLFRQKNPEVILVAYNGYGGIHGNTGTPFRKTIDNRWLEAFDALYCGDPRPADVVCGNFWRSKDIYSDHVVFQYVRNGIPYQKIDNTAFMIGLTGTCYNRGKAAWKGMLILSLARGGWLNTYYGNLELLHDKDLQWFAKVQSLFFKIQKTGQLELIGETPGKKKPYAFHWKTSEGTVTAIVNPSLQTDEFKVDFIGSKLYILFRDAGFLPILSDNLIQIGAGQLVLLGSGSYNNANYQFGTSEDVVIPESIVPLDCNWQFGDNSATTKCILSEKSEIWLVFDQYGPDGIPKRTTGGSGATGISMEKILQITVIGPNGNTIPIEYNYDKAIWSGLSWALAKIKPEQIEVGKEYTFSIKSLEKSSVTIRPAVYKVK